MPVPSLNKVVSLFLVGGLALACIAAVWWTKVLSFVGSAPQGALAIASALSIPLAGAAGVVVDGLADLLFRRAITKTSSERNKRGLARLFRQDDDFESFDQWRTSFDNARRIYLARRGDCPEEMDERVTSKDTATGIFLTSASPHLFEWVISHYAMYYLATSSSVVLIAGLALPIRLVLTTPESPMRVALVVPILFSVWASLGFAVDRYLYTYEAIFRFSTQWLYDEVHKLPPGDNPLPRRRRRLGGVHSHC